MRLTVPLTVVAGDRPRIEVTDHGEGACLTYQKWALPGTGSADARRLRRAGRQPAARATLVTETVGCADAGTVS
jgi:hypothetical protein